MLINKDTELALRTYPTSAYQLGFSGPASGCSRAHKYTVQYITGTLQDISACAIIKGLSSWHQRLQMLLACIHVLYMCIFPENKHVDNSLKRYYFYYCYYCY